MTDDDRLDGESAGDQSEGDKDEVQHVVTHGEVLESNIYENEEYGTPTLLNTLSEVVWKLNMLPFKIC